jgi:uncharacterized protein (TIGR02147 family)
MDPNKEIFLYSDYRQFLKDYYTAKKNGLSKYSYKLFSETIGFSSASFLKLVIDGKKNLTKESVLKIARGLKLNKKASESFETIVFFNQAKTVEDKTWFLEKLDKFRKRNSPEKLLPKEYEYLKEWYHCVIREMVDFPDFVESAEYIRKKLFYTVKPEEIASSLAFLVETGFLVRDGSGKLRKRDKTIATGEISDQEALGTIARAAHLAMIGLAKRAVSTLSKDKRNVTNTALCLSKERYAIALKRTEQLRMELLELAASDTNADQVFILNTNLFPLTKRDK